LYSAEPGSFVHPRTLLRRNKPPRSALQTSLPQCQIWQLHLQAIVGSTGQRLSALRQLLPRRL
jgi:hypothetical protein